MGSKRSGRVFRPGRGAQALRRKIMFYSWGALGAVMLLLGGLSYASHDARLQVSSIEVVGNVVLVKENIAGVAREELRGKYPLWFSKSNTLIFPRRGIENRLLEEFPRIETASVAKVDEKTLIISVSEREPFALWCGENFVPLSEIYSGCYFLDERGFIFSSAPAITGTGFFRYFGALPKAEPIAQQFIPEERFRALALFIDLIEKEANEPVFAFSVLGGGLRRIHFSEGGELFFSEEQDLLSVLTHIKTAFASEPFLERDRSSLEYLDVRFGNKLYYKFSE